MEKLVKLTGLAGLILIITGGITYGTLHPHGWVTILPLVLGLMLSVTSMILSMKKSYPESRKRSLHSGLNITVSIVFFMAILVFIQTIARRHTEKIDTTSNRRFSLSPQTRKIVRDIESETMFNCFFKMDSPVRQEMEDLLENIRLINPLIKYRFLDPDREPLLARKYGVDSYRTTVIESGKFREKIDRISEQAVTNALLRIVQGDQKVVYLLINHGERSINDQEKEGLGKAAEALEGENYRVSALSLIHQDSLPSDTDLIVMPGPQKDILSGEVTLLEDYISGGGKAMFLIDPFIPVENLNDLLGHYGLYFEKTVIVDRFGKAMAGDFLTPVVNNYAGSGITSNFNLATIFPRARTVSLLKERPSHISSTILATTGESAYAETRIDTLLSVGKTQFEADSDIRGPCNIAAASLDKSEGDEDKWRVVVFGDSDFISNKHLDKGGNRDFFLNSVNWLTEEEDLITIRPKEDMFQPVILSESEGNIVFWIPFIGIPSLIVVTGILVITRRRKNS